MCLIEEYIEYHSKYASKFKDAKVCVLMQVGSFYECYQTDEPKAGPDTLELSKVMNIIRTRRDKRKAIEEGGPAKKNNPHIVGINKASFEKYLTILVDNDYTVIQIDQVTEPPNPKRDVVCIHSPSTSLLNRKVIAPDLLVIVAEEIESTGNIISGLAQIDLSTGKGSILEVNQEDQIGEWMQKFTPKEVIIISSGISLSNRISEHRWLVSSNCPVHKYLLNDYPEHHKISYLDNVINSVYTQTGPLNAIESIGLEKYPIACQAWVHAIEFIKDHDPELLRKPSQPKIILPDKIMSLDRNALLDLRVVTRGDGDPSLLQIIKKTLTSMGSRLLRYQLSNPIRDNSELLKRYKNIEIAMENLDRIRDSLRTILDLERLHRSWELLRLLPSQWVRMINSYQQLDKVTDLIPDNIKKTIFFIISETNKVFDVDKMKMINNWNDNITSFIKAGISEESDIISDEIMVIHKNISFMEAKISKVIDANIKINISDKYGYTFLTTEKRSKLWLKDNKDWDKKKIGKNVRMWNNDLMVWGEKLIVLEKKLRNELKKVYFAQLELIYDKIGYQKLNDISNVVAELDVSQSHALCAIKFKYVKPEIINNGFLIEDLRHPIVERIQTSEEYVPNDIELGKDLKQQGICLFAPNAAGKSTLMTSLGLSVVLAQAGSFVPAKSFKWKPIDGLFTRINASDKVGVSSFVAEMLQLKNIIKRTTSNSLVLSDEACNMTENISALSISAATLDHLIRNETSFLFATHLHKLTDIEEVKCLQPKLRFKHLSVSQKNGKIVYQRKLIDDAGPSVYGLKVATHIINDTNFLQLARRVQTTILPTKQKVSRYNAGVYLGICAVCRDKPAVDAHHIKFQTDADKDGYHGINHKNVAHNLVGLCKKCHKYVHKDKIIVRGWIQTDEGRQLDWERVSKKLSKEEKEIVNKYKGKRTRKEIEAILKNGE